MGINLYKSGCIPKDIPIKSLISWLDMEFDQYSLNRFIQTEPGLYVSILNRLSTDYTPYEFYACSELEFGYNSIAIWNTDIHEKSSIIYKKFSIDISPAMFVQELTTYVETELLDLKNEEISKDIKVHLCTQCGAVLKKDSHVCEY